MNAAAALAAMAVESMKCAESSLDGSPWSADWLVSGRGGWAAGREACKSATAGRAKGAVRARAEL
jgi:hypothetical protein